MALSSDVLRSKSLPRHNTPPATIPIACVCLTFTHLHLFVQIDPPTTPAWVGLGPVPLVRKLDGIGPILEWFAEH